MGSIAQIREPLHPINKGRRGPINKGRRSELQRKHGCLWGIRTVLWRTLSFASSSIKVDLGIGKEVHLMRLAQGSQTGQSSSFLVCCKGVKRHHHLTVIS